MSKHDIAVIGMAGRFPGAPDVESYWRNLCAGVESITRLTDEDLSRSGVPEDLFRSPNYVKAAPLLDDVDRFDALFFGITPREAEIIDPQNRIFLECAWEALEHAGVDPHGYDGLIGVYAGSSFNSYLLNNLANRPEVRTPMHDLSGIHKDFLTTHVSFKLNLRGPSVTVQSFCSTSLVAIHLSCQSLLNQECDVALAGGVTIRCPQRVGYSFRPGGMESPDGHCRPFDASAGGTLFGSGAGVVVLKRFEEAVADGDFIHAVVRGSAINNDGSLKVSYAAPSVEGQAAVIVEALAVAGIEPEDVGFIEAHGTGTAMGDPIEFAALAQALGPRTGVHDKITVGSVKSNIGHLDAAAGVASFIKAVLVVKHGLIPPTLHFQKLNPAIDLCGLFRVSNRLEEWMPQDRARIAGVTSLGFGGTNAHVVLAEPPNARAAVPCRKEFVLTWSAKTAKAADQLRLRLAAHVRKHPDASLAELSYTLQVGRRTFEHRGALVCQTPEDAVQALEDSGSNRVLQSREDHLYQPVAFLFPGQGSQYVDMGLGLYRSEHIFREQFDRCTEILSPHLGLRLTEVLYPPEFKAAEAAETLAQTAFAQPALFAVEYALAQLWMQWGIRPAAMIGHSLGEYVAACLAGVFSLEDGLKLVAARGKLMQQMRPGAMLAVPLGEEELRARLPASIDLAAVNGPQMCTIAGEESALTALQEGWAAEGMQCHRLQTSHAFHSAMMEPAMASFLEALREVRLRAPEVPYVSNVTGAWATAAQATDPEQWVRQMRAPVLFSLGLSALMSGPSRILLEVGPGRTLNVLARRHVQSDPRRVLVTSLRHHRESQDDATFIAGSLARLWLAGATVDWSGFHAHGRHRRTPLPTYPFERKRFWLDPIEPSTRTRSGVDLAPPAQRTERIADWFYVHSWRRLLPGRPRKAPEGDGARPRLVLFAPDGEHELSEQLEARSSSELIAVSAASQAREDYRRLFRALTAAGKAPDQVVQWLPHSEGESPLPFFAVLALIQELDAQFPGRPVEVTVVTQNAYDVLGTERVEPSQAMVHGLLKVVPQEYPNLRCRAIDLSSADVPALVSELVRGGDDPVVALRGGHRWAQTHEPLQRPIAQPTDAVLKQGGVYLITGGLGEVGLVLAEILVRRARAKLILTSRSGLPPRESWPRILAGDSPPLQVLPRGRWPDIVAAARETVLADLPRPPQDQLTPEVEALTNELCTAHIVEYWHRRGIDLAPGRRYSRSEIKRRLGLLPKFEKLLQLFIRILSEDGVLAERGGELETTAPTRALRPSEVISAELARRSPEHARGLALLTHCVRNYDRALSGKMDAIEVLYPDGQAVLLRELGRSARTPPDLDLTIATLAQLLRRVVSESPDRKIRVLEVGAGDGHLTRAMIAAVSGLPNVEYWVTDLARSFVLSAEDAAQDASHDFLKFGVLDISKDPQAQGYSPGGFDLVLGLNVIHATPRLRQTLGSLKSLLRPGGLLSLIETVKSRRWVDMVWGLSDGWWCFEDSDLRTTSPLLGRGAWCRLLQQLGFGVVTAGQRDPDGDMALLLAQRPIETANDTGASQSRELIRRLTELERLGGTVRVLSADVADSAAMRAVLKHARDDLGPISGVIHAAGVVGDDISSSTLKHLRRYDCQRQFHPKVQGIETLNQALRGIPLDFAILISSNASVLGGIGLGAYAAANAYLDAVAARSQRSDGPRWISTNWDGWPSERLAVVRSVTAHYAMSRDQAEDAFLHALANNDLPQQIVSAGDLTGRIMASVEALQIAAGVPRDAASVLHARPGLSVSYLGPRSDLERRLVGIWQEVFGIEPIGVLDNFFELGGHSLIAAQIVARLKEALGNSVPLASLISEPTIERLVRLIEATPNAREEGEL